MTHHSSLCQRAAQACLLLGATLATSAALAVNSLPGGPAVNQIDLHPPVTRIAVEQQWLHNFMLIICTVIFIGVFGVMFYSIIKHRKSKGAKPAHFHESVAVEIAWTVVPFIIVIFMALPATKVVVAMKDTIQPTATGHITNTARVVSDTTDPATTNNLVITRTFVEPLAFLAIQRLAGNRVRVSWPVTLTNQHLQQRTNLTLGGNWYDIPAIPVVISNQNTVTEPVVAPSRYYRLRR